VCSDGRDATAPPPAAAGGRHEDVHQLSWSSFRAPPGGAISLTSGIAGGISSPATTSSPVVAGSSSGRRAPVRMTPDAAVAAAGAHASVAPMFHVVLGSSPSGSLPLTTSLRGSSSRSAGVTPPPGQQDGEARGVSRWVRSGGGGSGGGGEEGGGTRSPVHRASSSLPPPPVGRPDALDAATAAASGRIISAGSSIGSGRALDDSHATILGRLAAATQGSSGDGSSWRPPARYSSPGASVMLTGGGGSGGGIVTGSGGAGAAFRARGSGLAAAGAVISGGGVGGGSGGSSGAAAGTLLSHTPLRSPAVVLSELVAVASTGSPTVYAPAPAASTSVRSSPVPMPPHRRDPPSGAPSRPGTP